MKKAIIYCRVSTVKQLTDGDGLNSQEYRCREYADREGYQVANVFHERGVSGKVLERPAMEKLFAFLKTNFQYNYIVIIDDLKRLARDIAVHTKLRIRLDSYEATLRSPNFQFGEDIEDKLVENITASVAQYEREANARQTKQKTLARMQQGFWCFCAPTGYTFVKDPITKRGKLLIPSEPDASIIKEAFEGFAYKRFTSLAEVGHFLTASNLSKSPTGKFVHVQFVHKLFEKKIYAGLIEYLPWDVKERPGKHEGLISVQTFYQVQANLGKFSETYRTHADNPQYPLKRLISCAHCSKAMTAYTSTGRKQKRYAFYSCKNKACTASPKNHRKENVERAYLELLGTLTPSPALIKLTKLVFERAWEDKKRIYDLERELQLKEHKQIDTQVTTLLDCIVNANSRDLVKMYENKIKELTQQKNAKVILEIFNEQQLYHEALETSLEFLRTAQKCFQNADVSTKKQIHNLIFTVNPTLDENNTLRTAKTSVLFRACAELGSGVSPLVEMRGIEPRSSGGR